MAGDHKCPVCQATFTRPQHVARHMRSHTGDRPYKCQHCGDQFARSDLLSRHVNKCHAGDKPPTTTAPTRRKGQHGTSSTRATTSKQACDQCVIATLPCDGAMPCSKCTHRKYECTYVKFQRQTAPIGPGHKHNPSAGSISSTSSSSSLPRADDLFLVPPPISVPSMAPPSDLYYSNPVTHYSFGQPHAWEESPNPPPLSLSASTADDNSPPNIVARYQEDLLRRASASMLQPNPGASLAQPLFANAQDSIKSDQWQQGVDLAMPQAQGQEGFSSPYLSANAPNQMTGLFPPHPGMGFTGGGLYNLHARRSSLDGYSDGGSGTSAVDSATSSSVHLPLEHAHSGEQQLQQMQTHEFDSFSVPFSDASQHPPPSRDGTRFSSAFGLLSLGDDRTSFGEFNAPQGNAPFFSGTAMKYVNDDSTPRPMREDELQNTVRDRETEMQELRDFWKQYLRTPFSVSSFDRTPRAELGQMGEPPASATATSFGHDGSRPGLKRGLSRVASLPSVRTPASEDKRTLNSRLGAVPTPGIRVHTTDDLKRYEEAVLARKPPTTLNLVPRRSRLSNASSVSPGQSPSPRAPQIPALGLHAQFVGSNNSFVPNVSGVRSQQTQNQNQAQAQAQAQASGEGSSNSSDESRPSSGRPSFKRLPSQNLENAVSKRALFRWGQNEEVIDDTDSEVDGPSSNANSAYRRTPVQVPEMMLHERYRRQSAPSAGLSDPSNHGIADQFQHHHPVYSYPNTTIANGSPLNPGLVQTG